MTEIKNCPFCGSDNLSYVLNDNEDQSIWCENCSAAGPIHIYQIEAEMAWNTRADVELSKTEVRLEDYAIALQQAIEHHCKGEKVPAEIALRCPYHAKLLDDTRTDDWISVKDRLPKNDDEVLVSTRLKNIGIGWWDSYWRSDLSVKEITHWMPMPAPPEEER